MKHIPTRFALGLLLLASAIHAATPAASPLPPALHDFTVRVESARRQLPLITAAAEAAAARTCAHPDVLVNITYARQSSFAEELLNRSGGLAGALPSEERPHAVTANDIVVFSIRSWEANGAVGLAYLRECREKGWQIILFASQKGRPDDLDVDGFIDNGAQGGGEDEAAVNSIANALNGWLWTCEYTAALTRLGKHPGILQSITTAGSAVNNRIYQDRATRHRIYPCETALPAGDLARIYLQRVDRLVADLSGPTTLGQLERAASLIAARLHQRRKVFVSTNTHIMLNEMGNNLKTPWTALATLRNMPQALAENVAAGDLFFWLGYNGVSIWHYPDSSSPSASYIDYATPLRDARVDLIACIAPDPLHPDNNGQDALVRIDQPWDFGDAEVPIPFPPGRMAPVSGLSQGLLYRMLDDLAAARLVELTAQDAP